jgi:hypothetical protein
VPPSESPLFSFRDGATGRNRNQDQNVSVMLLQHPQEFGISHNPRTHNSEFNSDYQRIAAKARNGAAGQKITIRFA